MLIKEAHQVHKKIFEETDKNTPDFDLNIIEHDFFSQ